MVRFCISSLLPGTKPADERDDLIRHMPRIALCHDGSAVNGNPFDFQKRPASITRISHRRAVGRDEPDDKMDLRLFEEGFRPQQGPGVEYSAAPDRNQFLRPLVAPPIEGVPSSFENDRVIANPQASAGNEIKTAGGLADAAVARHQDAET